ncbi:MAG: hypothetical protein C5B54_01200 [Acidobacteria bacterium]|nr:MAG: hypothetical protein C5B54_01200 [Acidobacteriota bacterium]
MCRFYFIVLLTILVLSVSAPAFSQSCSLCYTQAASAGEKVIQALRNGILVLLIPPILISAGITYLAYRKRKSFRNESETQNFGW